MALGVDSLRGTLKYVERPHLVRFISEGFSVASSSTVVLRGEPGIGKSRLANEVALAHRGPVLRLTVDGQSRWGYSHEHILDDLLEQTSTILNTAYPPELPVEDAERLYRRQISKILLRARRSQSALLFVVDGLSEVPADAPAALRSLVNLIPLGQSALHLLAVSPPSLGGAAERALSQARSLDVVPLGRAEIAHALSHLSLSDEHIRALEAASRGVPAVLQSLVRQQPTSRIADALVAPQAFSLQDAYQQEWNLAQPLAQEEAFALAVLAEDPLLGEEARLAEVLYRGGFSAPALDRFSFVERSDSGWRFVSGSFSAFASARLSSSRNAAVDAIVAFYSEHQSLDPGFERTTRLLSSAGATQKVLELLGGERFSSLVSSSDSVAAAVRTAERGIDAAVAERDSAHILQFALQRSSVSDYASAALSAAEISALVAAGRNADALLLCDSELLLEARFRRYAALARAMKEHSGSVPPDVLQTIRSLYALIDRTSFGEEASGIAGDLMFSVPDIALELVSTQLGVSENSRDVSFALLALQASTRDDASKTDATSVLDVATSRIRNPRLRDILTPFVQAQAGQPASEFLAKVATLTSAEDRVLLLETWMRANRDRADALSVLDYALGTVVASAGYTATARTFRRLSRCLLFHREVHQLSYYVRVIDTHLVNLARIGPRPEYHRLLIQLARAVWRVDREEGAQRMASAYDAITSTHEPLDRAEALARLAGTIEFIDSDRSLEASHSLHSVVSSDLDAVLDLLLNSTADHADSLFPVVRALAQHLPFAALQLAERLNQSFRRDQALSLAVSAHLSAGSTSWSLAFVSSALHAIVDPREYDRALRALADQLLLMHMPPHWVSEFDAVVALARASVDPSLRAQVLVSLSRIAPSDGAAGTLREEACTQARLLQDTEERALCLMSVAEWSAARDRPRATELIDEARSSISSVPPGDALRSSTVALQLAVRASVGLFRTGELSKSAVDRLRAEIVQVSDILQRAGLLADATVAAHLGNASKDVLDTLLADLHALVASLSAADLPLRANVLALAAPALCLWGPDTATTSALEALAPALRDTAVLRAARCLRLSVLPGDPFEELPGTQVPLDSQVANRILDLVSLASSDASIFSLVECVIRGTSIAATERTISQAQRNFISSRVQEIARDRFPNPHGVAHEGYRVCIEILLDSFMTTGIVRAKQKQYVERIDALPNEADRVFVLCYICTYGERSERTSLAQRALDAAERLVSISDRVDRLEMLGRMLAPFDSGRSKASIRAALRVLRASGSRNEEERRRDLISLAYRISSDFGQGLAAATDSEPAKREIEDARRMHSLRSHFSGAEFLQVCEAAVSDLAEVCGALIGSLNAGRLTPANEEFVFPAIKRAASLSLLDAYPLLSLAVQNEVQRTSSRQKTVDKVLAPLFDASLRAASVARIAVSRLYRRNTEREALSPSDGIVSKADTPHSSTIIAGGTGARSALDILNEWLSGCAGQSVLVADPYFDLALLELLTLVPKHSPTSKLTVLTGPRIRDKSHFGADYQESVREKWWSLTADAPPASEIVVSHFRGSDTCPIHDRWWVTSRSGIELGTSAGGLSGRLTKVRVMATGESERVWSTLQAFADRTRRELAGRKIDYSVFTLD